MIFGKLWHSLMAQVNKIANLFWTADPIAQMQYEYDMAVNQLKEGRQGLDRARPSCGFGRGKGLKSLRAAVDLSDDCQVSPSESHGENQMERSNKTPGVNGIMDISEAADYLHIKKWTLYRLVKRGKIPGIKVGGQWRFKKEALDEMFTQNAD